VCWCYYWRSSQFAIPPNRSLSSNDHRSQYKKAQHRAPHPNVQIRRSVRKGACTCLIGRFLYFSNLVFVKADVPESRARTPLFERLSKFHLCLQFVLLARPLLSHITSNQSRFPLLTIRESNARSFLTQNHHSLWEFSRLLIITFPALPFATARHHYAQMPIVWRASHYTLLWLRSIHSVVLLSGMSA